MLICRSAALANTSTGNKSPRKWLEIIVSIGTNFGASFKLSVLYWVTLNNSESSKPAQIRTYLHETPQKTKTNMHKFAPSSVSTEQEQIYPDSHPLVEDTPAEDLLAAGGANSGRFSARCIFYMRQALGFFWPLTLRLAPV